MAVAKNSILGQVLTFSPAMFRIPVHVRAFLYPKMDTLDKPLFHTNGYRSRETNNILHHNADKYTQTS